MSNIRRKIIVYALLISYLGFSQFIVKAYVTTEEPSKQDFCFTKTLDKHDDKYQCRKTSNTIISSTDIDVHTIIHQPIQSPHHPPLATYTITYTAHKNILSVHAPPDQETSPNYAKIFLIGPVKLTI